MIEDAFTIIILVSIEFFDCNIYTLITFPFRMILILINFLSFLHPQIYSFLINNYSIIIEQDNATKILKVPYASCAIYAFRRK